MDVSAAASRTPRLSTVVADAERAVAVLKKAQEAQEAEGQAMIALISQSLQPGVGGRLNVYA